MFCRFAGSLYLVNTDRDTERRIGLFPHLRISPILIRFRSVNDRIEGWIDFPAVEDVLCFLVDFITNSVYCNVVFTTQSASVMHSGGIH